MPKLTRWIIVMAAAAAALAWGGPDALVPLKDAAAATTQVSVAFVIDFGGSAKVDVGCVKVPNTDNEYQALLAFTQQEDVAPPTYANSGLLCSIGGIPSSGCGQADNGGYIYWSYWLGDPQNESWSYAQTGAGGTVHSCDAQGQNCDVEGWRFEDPGKGNGTDPPPEAPADYAAICTDSPPPTTTTTSTVSTTPTSTPTATSPAVGDGSTAPPTHPSAVGTAPGTGTGGAASHPGAAGASSTSTSRPPTPSHQGAPGPTTHSKVTSNGRSRALPDSAGATPTSLPHVDIQAIGGTPAVTHPGGSSGSAPVWIGGVLVLALLAGGLIIARRRARTD